jgi:NAD(P)-dependent dehydrogenase (short-subunit alcohol dehydrogenase family)
MLDPVTQSRLVERASGRLGKPAEVADAVAFPVSDMRPSSRVQPVDGGQSLQIG